jgi:hypothetical protein
MSNETLHWIKYRILLAHQMLLRASETVDEKQFEHVFSEEAPPMGWHLWHMARFADRLQSKLSTILSGSTENELWYQNEISKVWGVDPAELGVYETGMGQPHGIAQATIRQARQTNVIKYAKISFRACNAKVQEVSKEFLDKVYSGVLDYGYDDSTGSVWPEPSKESTIAQDLMFHSNHSSRHLGMMEALRGLLGRAGTITV